MARGLLASDDKETEEEVNEQARQLSKSLQVPEFAHVLSCTATKATRAGERSAVVAACAALELPPHAVMVVSDQGGVLRAARQAGSFSCHLVKQLPGAPKNLPADFTAKDCAGVKDAVEELNGVTFRDPDTEIRTKYGVSAT